MRLSAIQIPKKDDWLLKGLFFMVWLAPGFLFPYIIVYYRSLGLSGIQIGLITTTTSLVSAFAATLWGSFSDRSGKVRTLFTIICGGAIVLSMLLSRMQAFPLVLMAAGLLSIFSSPMLSLVDSTGLKILGEHKTHYGAYRVWGTIGFILTSSLSGFLLEQTGLKTIFIAYAMTMVLFWFYILRLPDLPVQKSIKFYSGLQEMIKRPSWALFAFSVFILWASSISAWTYLGVTIIEMGGSERIVGLSSTIAAITEIPLLFASYSVLRKFGAEKLLIVAIITYTIRLFFYGFMPSYQWALLINCMQGITYCPFLIGAVEYANNLAPSHLKATSQGMLASIMSLSSLVGGLGGGILYDTVGRPWLYFILSGVCSLSLILFLTGLYIQKRRSLKLAESNHFRV